MSKAEYLKQWRAKNRKHCNEQRMNYYYLNQKEENRRSLEYFYKHRAELNKHSLEYYYKNRERLLQYNREYLKKYPRSSPELPYDIREAMNRVKKKQNNTCQWYECGLTNRETIIQVHHIFPQKEHPDLATNEQYMICYCWEHHNLWHKKRRKK